MILAVASTLVAGCSGPADDGAEPNSTGPAAQPAWEGVIRAGSAIVTSVSGGALDGQQVVELGDVDGEVVIFADRPTRRDGEMRIDEFVALWHGGTFGSDPPNAAILVDGEVFVVELTGAVLDLAERSMALTARPLAGSAPDRVPDGPHGSVTLFVDSFPTAVNGQITDSIAQTNVKVLGEAPALAMGSLYQTIASASPLQPTVAPSDAYESVADSQAPGAPAAVGTNAGIPGLTAQELAILGFS